MPPRIRFTALLLLLSAVVVAAADTPRPNTRPSLTLDLETLPLREAERLDGQRARFRITLDSQAEVIEQFTVCDCTSADDVHRTVWMLPEQLLPERSGTVEAVLRIIRHPASNGFPPLVEFRLTDASQIR